MHRGTFRSATLGLVLGVMAALGTSGCDGEGFKLGTDQQSSAPDAAAKSVLDTSKIQQGWACNTKCNKKIKPTAVLLHWWGNDGSGGIDGLVNGLNSVPTTFDPSLKSTDKHPENGHTSVQVGVDLNGKAYQLTPTLDTFARHGTCANDWTVGVEIAGSKPGSGSYIGDNEKQFKGVVAVVRELMATYDIPAKSVVGPNARSGSGIVSHHTVDAKCTWKDGVRFGSGKTDVGQEYLDRVLAAVR